MSLSNDLVLDASVITSYLIGEAGCERIHGVLRTRIERGYRLLTVDFAQMEVANALWRACTLKGLIDSKTALESIRGFYRLPLELLRQDKELLLRATSISFISKLCVYDTAYIALAEREKAGLFTSDRKQHAEAEKYVSSTLV